MKKSFWAMIALLVGLATLVAGVSVKAEVVVLPSVGEIVTTAGGVPIPVDNRNAAPASDSTTPSWVRVVPVLLPVDGSPSWAAAAKQVITDAVRGTNAPQAKVWSGGVASPTEYTVPPFRGLEWWMLAESASAPMWRGELNPPAPFGAERGWVLWHLIDARSADGSPSISLAGITLVQNSSDGNALGATISMVATEYTDLAVGLQPDGTLALTNGPASGLAQRVLFLAKGKRFNGGGTQQGLNEIRSWVNGRAGYAVTMTALLGGRMSSSPSYLNPPALPEVTLALARATTNTPANLRLNGGKVGSTYVVQTTGVDPVSGPWIDAGVIEAGEVLAPYGGLIHSQFFFRAVPQ